MYDDYLLFFAGKQSPYKKLMRNKPVLLQRFGDSGLEIRA
jgi:hypothetical protein